mgnify:CR=1 FL=1
MLANADLDVDEEEYEQQKEAYQQIKKVSQVPQ